MPMHRREALIHTPAIEEACSYLEAFVRGAQPPRLCIVGPCGCGKTFLAGWAQDFAGRTSLPIYDGTPPPAARKRWLHFTRRLPPGAHTEALVVRVQPPEYERKRGILLEWARVRNWRWDQDALAYLLELEPSGDLRRLRSLAERLAMQSGRAARLIRKLDVIRTLGELGYLHGE